MPCSWLVHVLIPEHDLAVIVHHGTAKGAIIGELRTLFSDRPVWSELALRERITSAKGPIDTDLLAKIGYIFRSGLSCCLPKSVSL